MITILLFSYYTFKRVLDYFGIDLELTYVSLQYRTLETMSHDETSIKNFNKYIK